MCKLESFSAACECEISNIVETSWGIVHFMKQKHHLPSPEFLFFLIHLTFSTGKWPHPFCHFLAPFKHLAFCFLTLQDRSSYETLSALPVWDEILQMYHLFYTDQPGISKQELCYSFISKTNLQKDLYGVFSLSDTVCPQELERRRHVPLNAHCCEAPVCFIQASTSIS